MDDGTLSIDVRGEYMLKLSMVSHPPGVNEYLERWVGLILSDYQPTISASRAGNYTTLLTQTLVEILAPRSRGRAYWIVMLPWLDK
jgi:hypothetical protein